MSEELNIPDSIAVPVGEQGDRGNVRITRQMQLSDSFFGNIAELEIAIETSFKHLQFWVSDDMRTGDMVLTWAPKEEA